MDNRSPRLTVAISRLAPDLYTSAGELARAHGDMSCFLDADTKDGLKRRPDTDEHLLPDHDLCALAFLANPFLNPAIDSALLIYGTVFGMIATIPTPKDRLMSCLKMSATLSGTTVAIPGCAPRDAGTLRL